MEKALELDTHIEMDWISHTVAARDTKLKGHFLAGKRCFWAVTSRSME